MKPSCSFSLRCRKKVKQRKMNENVNIKEESPLEILLRNINPSLACEIRQCWIETESFTVENYLGKGIPQFLLSFNNC